MASSAARFSSSISRHPRRALAQLNSAQSKPDLEESIRAAVEAKAYEKIPQILNASPDPCRNPNPFNFLSKFPDRRRLKLIDEMLQSFIPIRPRSQPRKAYSCLLSLTLAAGDLPLALAVVQRTLRSGLLPPPQIHLLLAQSWLNRRRNSDSNPVWSILQEMDSVGYSPDCGTMNYLIQSLCKIDEFAEAIAVLRGMGRGGCIPDSDSYGALIGELSEARRVGEAAGLMREMVGKLGVRPRGETVGKLAAAMVANREAGKGAEMVEWLEGEGVGVGFGVYEGVVEGLVEEGRFVAAGRFAAAMGRRKGFVPFVGVRRRVVEGLVGVGEVEGAGVVRGVFREMGS